MEEQKQNEVFQEAISLVISGYVATGGNMNNVPIMLKNIVSAYEVMLAEALQNKIHSKRVDNVD